MGRGSSKVGGGGGGNVPVNPQAMTDATADAIRQQEDSMYGANTTAAIKMYISNTDFDRDGHSLSQTMNYLLDQGVDFSKTTADAINRQFGLRLTPNDVASMQYTQTRMNAAFHPIGQDTKLQRGAHDDLLRNTFGIKDYSTMTEAQLQKALVGQGFRNTSPMSTSYDINKNPFLGNGPASGGREVVYNINAGANTPMLFGAKKQSEVVLGYSNFRITGVRYNGKTAFPRNGSPKPQLEIDIETF